MGWVRASDVLSPDAERELLELRAEVLKLREQLASTQEPSQGTEELAQGVDSFEFTYDFNWSRKAPRGFIEVAGPMTDTQKFQTTWDDVFRAIGPTMIDEASIVQVRRRLDAWITQEQDDSAKELVGWDDARDSNGRCATVNETFDVVLVQLRALKLIERSLRNRSVNDKQTYFSLTRLGDAHLTRLLAVRRVLSNQAGG